MGKRALTPPTGTARGFQVGRCKAQEEEQDFTLHEQGFYPVVLEELLDYKYCPLEELTFKTMGTRTVEEEMEDRLWKYAKTVHP